MITLEKVSKRYADGGDALQNVSMHLPRGQMTFLTGHSGAGKSTLLQIIALIQRHSGGKITVNDIPYEQVGSKHVPLIRRHMGIIFQDPKLLEDATIYDNVALPLNIRGFRYQDVGKRVRAALDKVGLLQKEKCFPRSLSCGEQQRVGIARAVVHKPQILLADEPTGNLDPDLSMEIMQLFLEFNRVGMTQLIASHDVNLIQQLNCQIVTLESGQIQS